MNEKECIVLIKEIDKTSNVKSISYTETKCCVTFNNNTSFDYNKSNIIYEHILDYYENCDNMLLLINNIPKEPLKIYKSKNYCKIIGHSWSGVYMLHQVKIIPCIREIENFQDYLVYLDNMPSSRIKIIYDFGHYYRVINENGFKKLYPKSKVNFDNKGDNSLEINYFRQIAELLDDGKENSPSSFLRKQYEQLTYINSNSVLNSYIRSVSPVEEINTQTLIYPFYFNLSQKQAAENAFKSNISIIEGPPGTGKTQTILNIIANAIMQNKTVAIVSNNNAAIKNVQEKLQKDNYIFFTALLGKKSNKDVFFENQPPFPQEMHRWQRSEEEQNDLINEILHLQFEMDNLLKLQNKQALLKQELLLITKEKDYFDLYYEKHDYLQIRKLSFYKLSHEKIISFLVENYFLLTKSNRINFVSKLKLFFKYGFYNFKLLNEQNNDVIIQFEKMYYGIKIKSLNNNIQKIEKQLEAKDFIKINKECYEKSKTLFEAKLFDRFKKSLSNRHIFDKKTYYKEFPLFIKEYPVILSTTHALRSSVWRDYMFDYVIIDEASQVDLVTAALALSCCRNVVVVGDLKQLPHIVEPKLKEKCQVLFQQNSISHIFNYNYQSILSSLELLFEESIPKILLKEHYRCHPKIINFCNKKYYDGKLITFKEDNENEVPLILYKTAPGNHMRAVTRGDKGNNNIREIEVIAEELLKSGKVPNNKVDKIGFETPFRKQVQKAETMLDELIEKDTIHKYQGREKEIMIFSTVLDKTRKGQIQVNFVDDPHMINVAVSRAINQFVLITNDAAFKKHGTNIGDLIRYIEYNAESDCIVESEIISIFDLLYAEYSDKLLAAKSKIKNISKYKSECLMNYEIEMVLNDIKYKCFSHVHSVRLMLLINDLYRLNEDERRYASHPLTSADFVIYNKFDKKPVLVVEVDGFEFHENNPKQLLKDEMKDTILRKYGIEVLRIRTNESQGEKHLRSKLDLIIENAT